MVAVMGADYEQSFAPQSVSINDYIIVFSDTKEGEAKSP